MKSENTKAENGEKKKWRYTIFISTDLLIPGKSSLNIILNKMELGPC